MEELIFAIIEKSLVGGAFIYMLHYFLVRFSKALEAVGENLENVSRALLKMNARLDNIEKRIDTIERSDVIG